MTVAELNGEGRPKAPAAGRRARRTGVQRSRGVVRRGRGGADASVRARELPRPRGGRSSRRADGADQYRPGSAHLRSGDEGAPRRAVRGARALGVDDPQLPLGARERPRPELHRENHGSRFRSPAPTTSSWRRPSTSTACPEASSRSASTSAARSSIARRRPDPGGSDSVVVQLDLAHAGRHVAPDDRPPLPERSWVRLHPDTTELLRSYKARAGLLSIDAAVSALLEQASSSEPGA